MTMKHEKQAGFTLIEMSIVMAIVSVLVASALGAYKVQVAKQYRETTTERIKKIQDALATYRMQNNRIPCPASISAAPNSSSFGSEYKTSPTSNCFNAAPPASAGITTVQNTLATPANPAPAVPTANNIYIGAVPVKELGLPLEVAFDSWGRRFRYAVSAGLTSFDTTNHPFNPQNGVINVVDETNTPIGQPNGSPFIVVSSGKDGAGGVTYEGMAAAAACPAATTRQGKNCSFANNQPFVMAQYAENSNATTRFDDYIANDFGTATDSARNIDGLDDGISDWPATGSAATNVFLGYNSGGTSDIASVASGTRNTGVGVSSLQKTTSGTDNAAIGYQALVENTTGTDNAVLGSRSMTANTTGKKNSVLGSLALAANTTGTDNVAVGYNSLRNATSSANTAIGSGSMSANTTGSSNVAIGTGAMAATTADSTNTAVGVSAMGAASSMFQNIAIGFMAQNNASGGGQTIGIGTSALTKNAGNYNIGIGFIALGDTTTGQQNVAIGLQSGYHITTGSYNTGMGTMAMSGNGAGSASTGSNNSVLGYAALANNTTGNDNVSIGYRSMISNNAGYSNIAIGSSALASQQTGNSNIAIGNNALVSTNGSAANIAIGDNALLSYTWGWQNIAIGYDALRSLTASTSGSDIIGTQNIAIGTNAGKLMTSGYNTAVGVNALTNNTGANNGFNTSVGLNSMQLGANNFHDTAVGAGAGAFSGWAGGDNVFLGYSAGLPYVSGSSSPYCTWGGLQPAGSYTSSGSVMVGSCATVSTDWSLNASNDVFNAVSIGNSTIAADMAVAIGGQFTYAPTTPNSGVTLASSLGSIAIGAGAQATGRQSIVIGPNSRATGAHAIAIGASLSEPANTNDIVIGNRDAGANMSGSTYIRSGTIYLGNINSGDGDIDACATAGGANYMTGCFSPPNGNAASVHAGRYYLISDERLKKDIKDIDLGLGFIEKLRPVSYAFKADKKELANYGFIAQEVEKLVGTKTNLVSHDDGGGKLLSLSYTDLIAPVVKAVQELAAKVEKLAHDVSDVIAQLNPLKKTVSEQQARIDALEKTVAEMKAEIKAMKAK